MSGHQDAAPLVRALARSLALHSRRWPYHGPERCKCATCAQVKYLMVEAARYVDCDVADLYGAAKGRR